jgi:uncharacterized protein (TIGR03118 family)
MSHITQIKPILMKNFLPTAAKMLAGILLWFAVAGLGSCRKDTPPDLPTNHQSFTVVNLVGSDASITATRTDAHLLNGWGLAFSPTGTAWISSPGDHTSLVVNSAGAQALAPVTIPSHTAATGGLPSGQVFNTSTGFKLANGNPARFIFAGLDGVISGWNTAGAGAAPLVDRNGTSVYTGLTMGVSGTDTMLYAADFKSGKIDVFNKTMVLQTMSFTDPGLPAGYAPFNVQNIGGLLYVAYAQPDPVTHEKKGAGLGLVNVFNTNGTFVRRLATGDALNAPWGLAQAPDGWLTGTTGTILVGNFGDGHINAYSSNGVWQGTLQNNGSMISIDGLWAISFAPTTATAINPNWLYFTAGPAGETKGAFGYVTNGN